MLGDFEIEDDARRRKLIARSKYAPGKPAGMGGVGDELHGDYIKWVVRQYEYQTEALTEPFRKMVDWHRLYLAKKTDTRKKHEKWRANVFVPYPYSGAETAVASVYDILNSADPIIQVENVSADKVQQAQDIERTLDYTFRRNRWGKASAQLLRSCAIQGTTIPKLTWADRVSSVQMRPGREDVQRYQIAVKSGEQATGMPVPLDLDEYDEWVEMVKASTKGALIIPDMPLPGKKDIVQYSGPYINRTPIFHLRFDPNISDIEDHYVIIQREVKPLDWVLDRAIGPNAIFDLEQVQQAGSSPDGKIMDEWEEEVAEMMGIEPASERDPIFEDNCELLEVWAPNRDFCYGIVMNRKAVINHDPRFSPYDHGTFAYHPIHNIPVEGSMLGIGELQETEALYHEINTMRNLGLDATLLDVMPIFTKVKEVGLTDLQRTIKPGLILDVSNPNGLSQLTKSNPGLANHFRQLFESKQDIDETNATSSLVRGGNSTVGRVSATESERRYTSAQTRMKLKVAVMEEELMPMVKQMLMLWHQFGTKQLEQVAGGNPLKDIPAETFLNGIEMDFRFRGASKALNGDMQVQQLTTFFQAFGERMTAGEIRELMTRVLEAAKVKGVDSIVTSDGTKKLTMMEDLQQQQMLAQAGMPAQDGSGQPPEQLEGGEADAVMAEAEGEEAEAGGGQVQPPPDDNAIPAGEPGNDEGAPGLDFGG